MFLDPGQCNSLAFHAQIAVQTAANVLHNVQKIGRKQALRDKGEIRRTIAQTVVQKIDELSSANRIGPGRRPQAAGPQIIEITSNRVSVHNDHLTVVRVQPLQRKMLESVAHGTHFTVQKVFNVVDQFSMVVLGEGVKMLEIHNDHFARVSGKPIRDVPKWLADLRPVEAVKKVNIVVGGLRGDS